MLARFRAEREGSIPRALFCLNSFIDLSGPASTLTSQSVASADALDTDCGSETPSGDCRRYALETFLNTLGDLPCFVVLRGADKPAVVMTVSTIDWEK